MRRSDRPEDDSLSAREFIPSSSRGAHSIAAGRLIAVRALVLLLGLPILLASTTARAQFGRPRPDMMQAVASPTLSAVKPGGAFTLRVKFRVKAGAWYYGPKPGGKIVPVQPAVFTPPAGTPFVFGRPAWPPTRVHETNLGTQVDRNNVFMGEQILTVAVKVKAGAVKKHYSLSVELSGQVCTTQVCVPVKTPATFAVTVGSANVPNRAGFPAYPPVKGSPAPPSAGSPFAPGFAGAGTVSSGTSGPSATGSTGSTGHGSGSFDLMKQVRVAPPKTPWFLMLVFAFLGGLVMNVMPCVLPVVPIKVYSFLEHAQQDHRRAMTLALAFAAGMIAVFLVLGGIMASVRGLWGAQFQSPAFVTTLGAVMFLMGLWLMGAFTLSVPQAVAGAKVSGGDLAGSFGMGALATLLATPCSGPFLGGALAWAATQRALVILLTFATIGVGMACPYVALVAQPKLLKRLPKPGEWMETWKQSMALVMFGVTIYFVSVLPPELHVPFLLFCLAMGAGAWVFYRWGGLTATSQARRWAGTVALALFAAGAWAAYSPRYSSAPSTSTEEVDAGGLRWTRFDLPTLNRWLSEGRPVVVEWTADWCPNCKYIENAVYRQSRVIARLQRDVKLMRADITRSNPEASKALEQLGGQSIPYSVVFRANDPSHPIPLPDVYTAGSLLSALDHTPVAKHPSSTGPFSLKGRGGA